VEAGQTVRTDTEPDTTAWRRFLSTMLWTVAPEEFL
jgi:putative cardiolipin synthase